MRVLCLLAAALPLAAAVDFSRDVAPVLEKNCLACHGAERPAAGIHVTSRSGLGRSVVAGQPDASSLYFVLNLPATDRKAMPPGGPMLSEKDRSAIRQWIAEGAVWPANARVGKPVSTRLSEAAVVAELHARIVRNQPERSAAEMKPYRSTIGATGVQFSMTPIPGGTFTMGTPETEKGRGKDEGPQRQVTIAPFWMQTHEVTWDEYRLFMFAQQAKDSDLNDPVVDAISRPTRPYVEMSFGMGINGFPAISMTQHAANKYAQWLSARTGQFYRLPTEAEWEYACRAGATTAYSFGEDPAKLSEFAVFSANAGGRYAKVGTRKPNAWGLFDMHGNVMEWTLDQYAPYRAGDVANPWVKQTEPYPHVARGGSWNDGPAALRCGARLASDPSWKQQDPQLPKSIWYHTDAQWLGFRLVRPLQVPDAAAMQRYWNSGVEQDN